MPLTGNIYFEPEAWLLKRQTLVASAMIEIIDHAVEQAKRFTAERGTAKSGHVGRVDTEDMMNDIVGRVFSEGVTRVIGEFGFVNTQELYYMLQTITGFKHYLSGEFIEPTFALRDALILAVQELILSLKEIF